MTVNLNNLRPLIQRETVRAIREILEPSLTEDDSERRRQERLAATIDKKNLNAEDGNKASKDVDEVEEDEAEAEEEVKDTGVPSPDDAPQQDRSGGKGTADSPKLNTPTAKQIDNPSPSAVIDKLNALRGGKSLKDAAVRKSFEQYFGALGHSEKESLLVYLTAIAQILAGVTSGADAIEPSDVGLKTKSTEPTKTKMKVKTATPRGKDPLPGSEAIPIVVGEQQYKHGIKKILEAYKNFS